MRTTQRPRILAGVSLVETIIAMGVLAVAVPLAMAAMSKAGDVTSKARSETRAPAIADRCLLELKAARRGDSELIDKLEPGVSFPPSGGVIALAFSRDGRLLGEIDSGTYEAGVREPVAGEPVDYLARLSGRFDDPSVTVTVRVEFPAVRKAGSRSGVDFHTKLP